MSPRSRRPEIAYLYDERVYLNVTNRCPTACRFCAKYDWGWSYRGTLLRLPKEPSVGDLVHAAELKLRAASRNEAVFCGYGEPTERLGAVLDVSSALKAGRPGLRLRLNTIGLGSLSRGRDIAPELARAVDAVSVSVNTAEPEQWRFMHRPKAALPGASLAAVCDFIRSCVREGLPTTVTAVDQPGVSILGVELLAKYLGANFRLRPPLVTRRPPAG